MKWILALFLSVCSLFGQSTVNFYAGPTDRDVRDVTGAIVIDGIVIIGTPDGIEYGRTSLREIFGLPGRFADSASTQDSVYDNQPIWMTIVSDQGRGVFTSSGWRFPISGSLPPENTASINTSEVDQAIVGAFNQNHLILYSIPEPNPLWFLFGGLVGLFVWKLLFNET